MTDPSARIVVGDCLEVHRSSVKHEWRTPQAFFDKLHAEFGFTIDAAASDENAMLPRYWTIRDDGCFQSWRGERVWCNPPYGKGQKPFIHKAALRQAEVAVLLIPARPDTAIWHDVIFPLAEVRWVRGRLHFDDGPNPAPFPSAVVIFRGDSLD